MELSTRRPTGFLERAASAAPLLLAIIFSLVLCFWTLLLSRELVTIDGNQLTRFEHFLNGTPNAMGDTLAGFVGSLTLIWVVASVFQQSMELRAQRREFENMVTAQEAQVTALKEQVKAFQEERTRASEAATTHRVNNLLSHVALVFRGKPLRESYFSFVDESGEKSLALGRLDVSIFPTAESDDLFLRQAAVSYARKLTDFENFVAISTSLTASSGTEEALGDVLLLLSEIKSATAQMTDSGRDRLKFIKFDDLYDSVSVILAGVRSRSP